MKRLLALCIAFILTSPAYAAYMPVATVDDAQSSNGYIVTRYETDTEKRLKTRITGPDGSVKTYDMQPMTDTVIPLAAGNGTYTVAVYLQKQGISYIAKLTKTVTAEITNPVSPYLCSVQQVDYKSAPNTVTLASDLCKDLVSDKDKALAVCNFITKFDYSLAKAETVQGGYNSKPDKTLSDKTGICLDFAVLAAAMLRSQGIPCKLIYGYAGPAYHAWVSAYIDQKWTPIDPTARPGVEITEFAKLTDYIPTAAY